MAAQHQQYGTAPGPQPPQMSLPLINGPGRGRGAGPMPPTLLQMPSVYPGNTGGRQPQPPAQPDFPVETGGWSTLASGIAADLRGQTHAADSAPPPDGCARCRIWNGAVPGKQRPPRLDCSQYDSPVIANGDGTQSNWLGLHGWQVAPRNTGRQQVYRQAAPRRRSRAGARKRSAAAAWANSDASLSGSDTDESELSSAPSEGGGKGKPDKEWEAPKDLDRPELGDSDEDSEYEAMRRAKERRASGRGRRVASRSTRSRGNTPAAVKSAHVAAAPALAPAAAPPASFAAPATAVAGFTAAAFLPAATLTPEATSVPVAACALAATLTPVAPAAPVAPRAAAAEPIGAAPHSPAQMPEAALEAEPAAASEPESEPEPEPEPIVLERGLSEEDESADRVAVRSSPEFATILDFFQVFNGLLGLSRDFSAAELEDVLVASVGDEGLLPDIHMDLLRGIYPRIILGASNWARHLAGKLFAHWRGNMLWKFSDPPFLVAKEEDASVVYSTLPSLARVQALKALCEMRLDRDDCRGAIEAATAPRRRRKGEPDDGPDIESFRRWPLSEDAAGRTYWYHNFYDTTGLRLYREAPAGEAPDGGDDSAMATESADTSAPATDSGAIGGAATDGRSEGSAPGSPAAHDVTAASATAAQERAADGNQAPSAAAAAKARAAARPKSRGGGARARAGRAADFAPPGSQVAELEGGAWRCIATSVQELEAVGTQLTTSRRAADLDVASAILEEAVPEAVEAAEAVLRREQRREREVRSLGLAAGADGGFGRSQRARKQVDYTYSSYDDDIRAVTGTQKGDEPIPRWAADPEIKPTPAEEVAAGLRRGRSHRDAPLQPGLLAERALNGRSRTGTPAASASADAECSDFETATPNAADGAAAVQQQQTSRLQHVSSASASAGGERPAPQSQVPPGVGAPPAQPPAPVQFPTAAAPLPPSSMPVARPGVQQQPGTGAEVKAEPKAEPEVQPVQQTDL